MYKNERIYTHNVRVENYTVLQLIYCLCMLMLATTGQRISQHLTTELISNNYAHTLSNYTGHSLSAPKSLPCVTEVHPIPSGRTTNC
jgi:hypothetical protein